MTRLRSITSSAAVLAVLSIPTVVVAGAASAAPGEWETFHDEFSFIEQNGCGVSGLTLKQAIVANGREKFTAHGPDGLPYLAQFLEIADTVTNVATGESVTQVIDLRFADLKVTDNGDGTSTIIAQRPARTVFIQDGQVIARSAGLTRFEALIDNGGTPTDPSDDQFLDAVVIKDVGSNPVDFCATIVQAIG